MSRPQAKSQDEQYYTVSQAAKIKGSSRQSIYLAIRSRKLKCKFDNGLYFISKKDLEHYLLHRWNREGSMFQGQLLFDKSKGLYSVTETAKLLSIPAQRVYYDIRMERIKYNIKGCHYVIHVNDIKEYSEKKLVTYKKAQ